MCGPSRDYCDVASRKVSAARSADPTRVSFLCRLDRTTSGKRRCIEGEDPSYDRGLSLVDHATHIPGALALVPVAVDTAADGARFGAASRRVVRSLLRARVLPTGAERVRNGHHHRA